MRAGVEIVRYGTDLGEWMVGYQLAVNGKLSPMFDLHKSAIRGKTDVEYEALLTESAENVIRSLGPGQYGR